MTTQNLLSSSIHTYPWIDIKEILQETMETMVSTPYFHLVQVRDIFKDYILHVYKGCLLSQGDLSTRRLA